MSIGDIVPNYYGGAAPVYGVPSGYGAHNFTRSPT